MLEDQGGANLFGEPALNLSDLMRTDGSGRGYVNLLAADKLIASPRLYATFLLWLMSELFEQPWQVTKARAIIAYAEALKSRKAADFDAAAAAVTAAQEDKELLLGDDYKSELDEIADLLTKFPASEKQQP